MPTTRPKPRGSQRDSRSPRPTQRRQPADPSTMRRHFVAATGEFVGTFLFLFFAFLGHTMSATQAGETGPGGTPSSQQVVFVSLSYGLSLLVTAWTLYRISGGLFNPAVTLGLVAAGELPPVRGLILFPAQILGAMSAAGVVSAIIPGDISIVRTSLGEGMNLAQGVFLEMFLTAQLVFTILVLAADKSKDTFLAPIGIGLALLIVEIAGIYYTGASVNPARSFGPCVAAASFQSEHWIYWVGPLLGGVLAAGFYRFIKWMNYGQLEEANPGQDSADGAFDAKVERSQSQQAEEGQSTQMYERNVQPSPRYSGSGPPQQSYAPPQQNYVGVQPSPHQGWGANVVSEMDRRSGDMNRIPPRRY